MAFKPQTIDDRLKGMVVSNLTFDTDTKQFYMKLENTNYVSLSQLFAQAPTDALYAMRDLIEETLKLRPDARR